MPSSLGAPEILVILVVALIVLGPKRLPEAGRQIGRAMSEVRRWSQSVQSEIREVIDVDPDLSPPPPAHHRPTPAPENAMTTTASPATASPATASPATATPATATPTSAPPTSGDGTSTGTGADTASTPTTAAEPPGDGPPAGAPSPS